MLPRARLGARCLRECGNGGEQEREVDDRSLQQGLGRGAGALLRQAHALKQNAYGQYLQRVAEES